MELVVFDLEANADRSDPPAHEIVEIGAVLVSGGVEVAAFETLVRPTRALRDFTRQLTGLTDEQLADAPVPAEALKDFYAFVGGRPMVAHNGFGYDFPLLEAVGDEAGTPVPEVIRLDTLELAHLAFPRAGKSITSNMDGSRPPAGRSLDELARKMFGDDPRSHHRALGDARLLARVLSELLALLESDGPDRRLQRWVLGAGSHQWARLLAQEVERAPLEKVVMQPPPVQREPASGHFEPDDVAAMFDEGGSLMGCARSPRQQQEHMARHVAEALDTGSRRLIEAPTGTGKTLAYLAPAVEHARARGGAVVVAPHSKVLQDQIMATLEELSLELAPFSSVLVKGRNNYIDLDALAGELDALAASRLASDSDLEADRPPPEPASVLALAMVCGWVAHTPTGDWDDLRAGALEAGRSALSDLRRMLRTEDPLGPCVTRLDELDFYRRARDGLRKAHVAVLNHALVVSDHEWLDHSRRLVLDEAHNLEDAATEALSEAVGSYDLSALLDAVWDPTRRSGTLRRIADASRWPLGHDRADTNGTLEDQPGRATLDGSSPSDLLSRTRRCVDTARSASERFGSELVAYLRVRTGASADDRYPVSYRIRRGIDTKHPDFGEVLATGGHLGRSLVAVADAFNELNLPAAVAGPYKRSRLEAEVSRLGRRARHAARTIDAVLWAENPEEQIAIGEIAQNSDGQWTWELRRSPLSVAPRLRELWESLHSAVLTSATLRVGGKFSHVIDSLGLGHVDSQVALGSPFPRLAEHHLLLLCDYLPAPRSRLMAELTASAASEIPRLLMLTSGRGLVLMAARARMEFVRDHARPVLEAEGIPLLAQGDDSAAALVARMRAERASSLIALRSFWEGVDIPGEALSLLIIEKIPFDSPADPVVGARMDAIDQRGKDPFAEYLVPRAALRFAQGVGRLIRTETDRGVTAVLDSRLCRAVPYRDAILKTLPGPPRRERANRAEDAYGRIASHLGDIDLDGTTLERLRAVRGAHDWAGLAGLELSQDEVARPKVIAERLEQVRQLFGFRRWRPGQLEVVRRFIEGRDFLAVLPTGSGKSATFQIPALLSPGVTLVISPLKALMNDQAENLRARGITKAAAIHSGVGQAEWRDILRGAQRGDYKLLYVSPERLWSQEFVGALSRVGLARIAVDEAHCVSQWGHSFRPEYAAIPEALSRISPRAARPPVLAVTATATSRVRDDITDLLGLSLDGDPVVLSPERPEIRYFVEPCDNREDRDVRVVQIVEAFRSQPAIVYVPTRRDATRISGLLKAAGHIARPYHGAIDENERLHTEDAFRHGELDVVVATKAFGMGIDKPDIALIVHLEMPATIEEYVQETGRAARGANQGEGPRTGTAVLLTMQGDCSIHRIFVKGSAPSLEQVRRIWSRLRVGVAFYDPDELAGSHEADTERETVGVALAVHYLQESGALRRHLDTPWRGRVSIMDDTREGLVGLRAEKPGLAERGLQYVELAGRLGDEYRAESWARALQRPEADIGADLLELNGRDIIGFSVWKHAWTLDRQPGAEPPWAVMEARATERRAAVARKSQEASAFAKLGRGCRVRKMLDYFGADAPDECGRCDLCTELPRPWGDSHISREGLQESLPVRGTILQLLEDTRGVAYSRRNLERTLVGRLGSSDDALPGRLARHHLCGRLGFLGAPAVKASIDELIERSLASVRTAEHEGNTYERLEITGAGRDYLRHIG